MVSSRKFLTGSPQAPTKKKRQMGAFILSLTGLIAHWHLWRVEYLVLSAYKCKQELFKIIF